MEQITSVDEAGIKLIASFEGFRPLPYLDQGNLPTIGYGTIKYPDGRKVTMSDTAVTEEQAQSFMKADIEIFEKAVVKLCPVQLTQNQFNALVSFTYNCGIEALKRSRLRRFVNSNASTYDITEGFMSWVHVDGKPSNGLIKRRTLEAKLFNTNELFN